MKTPEPATRPAAVAGMFYPAHPGSLRQMVMSCLASAVLGDKPDPKAVIAPHAGYVYSGPIAGSALRPWQGKSETIRRLIVIGPAHRVYLRGLAVPSVKQFATPLGPVSLDLAGIEGLRGLPQVRVSDAAHAGEHSLEVELPFFQVLFPGCTVVPLLAGEVEDEEVEEVLDQLWGGPETRLVISSDLSHFHDYATSRRVDEATSEAILRLEGRGIEGHHACGYKPIRGLLRCAAARGMKPELLDLRSSGDTAGTRDRVVGYGAFAF